MSEFCFGLHSGHLTANADAIARRFGVVHVNYTEPRGLRRGWFAGPNRGQPFDQQLANKVMHAIDQAGGIEALTCKLDRRQP